MCQGILTISEYDKRHKDLISQKNQIIDEIASLGFFAFKKKKELNYKKSEISNKISEVLKDINGLDDLKKRCDDILKQADIIV